MPANSVTYRTGLFALLTLGPLIRPTMLLLMLLLGPLTHSLAQGFVTPNRHVDGFLASGASYVFDVPSNWNGTVLLYGHGYARGPNNPAHNSPGAEKDWLLEHGYALIGSSYSTVGWAVEQAVPDQLATLDTFVQQFGKPKRTIAWGSSMGGLVTMAIMERFPDRIDAGLVLCASVAGSVGMMNAALDGAFAFKTLAAPRADLPILFRSTGDQARRDISAWKREIDQAQGTPQGRARIALAATLAQIPTWIEQTKPQPAENDFVAQQQQLYLGMITGTLLPRDDQERRAGGNFSWNTGIDYARQLSLSGREGFVRALYQQAGLMLETDLGTLAEAPRVAATPTAVAYMKQNYVPTGDLAKPMLVIQTVADPMTLVEFSGDYARLVRQAGHSDLVHEAYVQRTGHCKFNLAETLSAVLTVERRLERGTWDDAGKDIAAPDTINALAASLAMDGSAFVKYRPAAFLRSCSTRESQCIGEKPGIERISAPGRYSGYSDQAYADFVLRSQYVNAADGTRLAVDIYRPSNGDKVAAGKLPVILVHYTSGRRNPDPSKHAARLEQLGLRALIQRGYVVAWMEPRGVGASFGSTNGFITPRMGADVNAVIEWLAVQPWSTGKIGMLGISNGALIQSMTAAGVSRHLVAIAPAVANPNFYYQLYPNGASAVAGVGSPAARDNRAMAAAPVPPAGVPVDEDPGPDYPLLKSALDEHRAGFGMNVEWLPNMFRDSFNAKVGYAPGLAASPIEFAESIKAANIRIYQMAGWFDSSPGGQLAAYKLWGDKIIVGSWVHGVLAENQGGPLLTVEYQRWFDHVLKGIDNGILDEPPVRYQVIHAPEGDPWRFAADWPIPTQRLTPYYFDAGRSGTVASTNDGSLTTRKPKHNSGSDHYRVNYDIAAFDGKFNRVARTWEGDMTAGVDANGLTYTTTPLTEALEMTGHPVAHLWVTSSAPDGNFILYIEEVDPRGASRFVTDGVMRAAHRKVESKSPWKDLGVPYHRSFEADYAALSPTRAVELAFDFNPISYVFQKGNRIRVTVTGAERMTYQLPPGADASAPPGINLYRSVARASYVALPLIPASSSRYQGTAQISTGTLKYDGPAELYPSAKINYLRLGNQWIKCASGSVTGRPLKYPYTCNSRIGDLRVERMAAKAGNQVRVSGEGIQFTGNGF